MMNIKTLSNFARGFVWQVIHGWNRNIIIGEKCSFSKGIEIVCGSGGISIGNGCRTREDVSIVSTEKGQIEIGHGCFLNRRVTIICHKQIKIGKNCQFGPNICIYDHDHKFNLGGIISGEYNVGDIVIDDNCWIGAGVIILRNTHIGKGSVIGAGTILKGEVPPDSLVRMNQGITVEPIIHRPQ